ncbi:preprotein translocase subunit SecE [Bradymonas sediminis]|uniref:Protein translocase subunit SecE n=1 Tax=Bradymonas sediminis TaxID=1548548 RepID=A0A2Z4FR64_9DELT|nr:preprotein translocase subunit SecE [Bradymonas sediminis]AWV91116.1 preprotein translocase subunit SecE [Bradymonas sediminis]TDP73671.1 protein translocase subunit secE/sec61 gamma [Bradymonas sediminis]
MDVSRYVNLVYFGIAILAFTIFDKSLIWLWESVDALRQVSIVGDAITLSTLIAIGLTVALVLYLYKRVDIRRYFSEVIIELQKVTWPNWSQTKRSTVITIVFTVVLSVFLWGSDQLWSKLTTWLLTNPGV